MNPHCGVCGRRHILTWGLINIMVTVSVVVIIKILIIYCFIVVILQLQGNRHRLGPKSTSGVPRQESRPIH